MTTLTTTWQHHQYDDARINESIEEILQQGRLLSLATISERGGVVIPHNATCAFTFTENLTFYILTPPTTEHGKNIVANPAVALTIFDSHQEPQDKKQGLQISGTCTQASEQNMVTALRSYQKTYQWMKEAVRWHSDWSEEAVLSWFYVIVPTRIKIFDEQRFGMEKIITLTLHQ